MNEKSSVRILTIDDEQTIRCSFRNYLEDFGYEVIEAENGKIGIETFRNLKPDLVLLDLRMPDVDGLDVLAEVTKISPETPVIVVSGTGVLGDVVDALRLGAWDYLLKPIEDLAVLQYSVEKVLERSNLIKENRKYQKHLEDLVKEKTFDLKRELSERLKVEKELLGLKNCLEEEVKKKTEELVRTHEELLKSERLATIGNLGATIAHEFRNQLGVIRNVAFYLKMKLSDKEESIVRHLKIMDEQILTTERIISNILAFANSGKPELKAVNLKELVEEQTSRIIFNLKENCKIQTVFDANLPTEILLDEVQMIQVFSNLIKNAIDAIDNDGTLKITLKKQGDNVECLFEDDGCGISEEVKARIFDPLYTTKARGVGLGLPTVKAIIEKHSGEISIDSAPSEGTSVRVVLPIVKD